MKRKLVLMAIAVTSVVTFSGLSVDANAAMNEQGIAESASKVIEYLNNYSATTNTNENVESNTSNVVDFNWSDYVNNENNSYTDTINEIINSIPEVSTSEDATEDATGTEDSIVVPDVSEDTTSVENGLLKPFVIDNILRIVHVGETYTINLVATPGEVVFTSSNPEVATIDENGNVVAVAPGKSYITVTTADGCRTRNAVVRVLGECEGPDIEFPDIEFPDIEFPDIEKPDIEKPDIEFPDINIDIDVDGNKPSINWPSVNWPSISWPSTNWPTIGGTSNGTTGSLGNGYANKLSTTPTTLSSAKGTSTSSLPNTGAAIPLEAIGAISLLGGLGIYKKRK